MVEPALVGSNMINGWTTFSLYNFLLMIATEAKKYTVYVNHLPKERIT